MEALNAYIVGSYIADKQQYEYNPLLVFSWQHWTLTLLVPTLQISNYTNGTHCWRFHDSTEHFYIVGSYIADKQQYEWNPLLAFPW